MEPILNFFSADRTLNIRNKVDFTNFLLSVKKFEKNMIYLLMLPILCNFIVFALIKGSNNIGEIFVFSFYKLFDLYSYANTFVEKAVVVFQPLAFFLFIMCYVFRVVWVLKLNKYFYIFQQENPNFYNKYEKILRISIIVPFTSFKIYDNLSKDANYFCLNTNKI